MSWNTFDEKKPPPFKKWIVILWHNCKTPVVCRRFEDIVTYDKYVTDEGEPILEDFDMWMEIEFPKEHICNH